MLYHKDVFLPKIKLPNGKFKVVAGWHAKQRGLILPNIINTNEWEIIEIELTQYGKKILYRTEYPYNTEYDICIVVNTYVFPWFIRTAWLNKKTDRHITLDTSKYTKR